LLKIENRKLGRALVVLRPWRRGGSPTAVLQAQSLLEKEQTEVNEVNW